MGNFLVFILVFIKKDVRFRKCSLKFYHIMYRYIEIALWKKYFILTTNRDVLGATTDPKISRYGRYICGNFQK